MLNKQRRQIESWCEITEKTPGVYACYIVSVDVETKYHGHRRVPVESVVIQCEIPDSSGGGNDVIVTEVVVTIDDDPVSIEKIADRLGLIQLNIMNAVQRNGSNAD